MSIGLLILAFSLLLIGLIGSFLPVLPGPPISWCGLLIAFFAKDYCSLSTLTILITMIITVFVTIADYIFPSIMTKKGGGTKMGSIGATVGLVVGFFLPLPILGLILCPFFGAFIFEVINDSKDLKKAFDSAVAAFKGFLLGTGLKAIVCASFIWILIANLLKGWF